MRKWIAPTFAVALATAIAVISDWDHAKVALHTHGRLHPWMHLLAFAVLSLTAVLCSRRTYVRLALLLGVLLLAWGTEYHEHVRNGQPVEQNDLQHDVLGIALGGAAGWLVSRRRLQRPSA